MDKICHMQKYFQEAFRDSSQCSVTEWVAGTRAMRGIDKKMCLLFYPNLFRTPFQKKPRIVHIARIYHEDTEARRRNFLFSSQSAIGNMD